MEQVMKCLAPFERATKMLEYKDSSISCFIPIVTITINDLSNITNQDDGIKTLKRKLYFKTLKVIMI